LIYLGTWEPPENLDGTSLIAGWKQVRKDLGEAAFRCENGKNIAAYHKAKKAAEVAKARKYDKREKKRKKLQRRKRRVVYDDASSEEERLMAARRSGGLFVGEQRRTASDSNAHRPPTPRKAPFQQSSSEEESSSEPQYPDDSLLGELRRKKKAKGKAGQREAREDLGSPILQEKNQLSEAVPATTPARSNRGPQRVNVSAVTKETTSSSASGQNRTVVTTTTTTQKTTDSAVSSTGGEVIRTAPPKRTNPGINFVDGPVAKRKGWSTVGIHYDKLHFRALAEKRTHTEGTPDFDALNFVNGPPPSLPLNSVRRSSSDPYARRDMTTRRVQEEDPDDRPQVGQDTRRPLANWEKDKVPMMCNAWKLSSGCPFGAERCFFMHRTHDPEGRPYKLGDMHNRVPQKYRKPPITCDYWYNGNRCKKPADECLYAHEDTGWTEINGKPIEREHVAPISAGPRPRDALPQLVPFKLQNPPITCHYWLRDSDGCIKSEAMCKYAHWNTGWAPPEHQIMDPPVQIDPDLRPRGMAPKYANPPIICPYWLNFDTGCSRPDEECKFAHFNTGWTRTRDQGPTLRIDPQQLPRSQTQRNIDNTRLKEVVSIPPGPQAQETVPVPPGPRSQVAKGLTCPAWLGEPRGCPKPEDACDYSHRNTGWANPKDRPFGPAISLAPNQIPRFQRDLFNVDPSAPKNGNPPITCFFWLKGSKGCDLSAANCKFAHRNTGWMNPQRPGFMEPEQIDRRNTPRFRRYGKRGGGHLYLPVSSLTFTDTATRSDRRGWHTEQSHRSSIAKQITRIHERAWFRNS
jgi:hypothetical protein